MRKPVQRQDQQKCAQAQARRQQQRFLGAHRPRGQRTVFGALDMRIEIAVGIIVDDATGGAHQHRAHDEYRQHHHAGNPACGKPQPPQCRPQQQENADGLIQPHQFFVMAEALRERHYASSSMEGRNTSVTRMDCPRKLNSERRAHRPLRFYLQFLAGAVKERVRGSQLFKSERRAPDDGIGKQHRSQRPVAEAAQSAPCAAKVFPRHHRMREYHRACCRNTNTLPAPAPVRCGAGSSSQAHPRMPCRETGTSA